MGIHGIVGNENLIARLNDMLETGRLPHAILIEGEAGCGKRTLARKLAAACVCRAESAPCGNCPDCSGAEHGNHADVMIAAGGEAAGSFKVDMVRNIRTQAYVLPNQADKKVFILENAGKMNDSAQNALLKVLEEPPAYAVFLLLCNLKQELLETIRSRCAVLSMHPVGVEDAAAYVKKQMPKADEAEIRKAAEATGGNIGKMLDGLQSGAVLRAETVAEELAEALIAKEEYALLKACAQFDKDKKNELMRLVIPPLRRIFRDALVMRCGTSGLSAEQTVVSALAKRLTKRQLMCLIAETDNLQHAINRYANKQILMTRFCSTLRAAAGN